MDAEQGKEQAAVAEAKVAETKLAEEKAATESEAKQDTAAEKLGKVFDEKADKGDEHSAYTETDEEKEAKEKEAKAKEAEAKTKADEEAGEKDPDKEVDDSLLERAVRVGLNLEKAREYGSLLERTVVLLEESQSEKEKTPDELETEKKAKEEAEAKVKEDEAPYDCGLDPAEYDENLIKGLNDLGTMVKKRIIALEASHSKHSEAIVSDRVTKHTDWLDSKVNRIADDDLKKVYGEGDIDDLEEGSEQFKARATLDTKITEIAKGLRDAKKPVPSRNKLFDLAIESLHKGKKANKADAETKAKLAERAKAALGGGSSKVSAETADAKALQAQKDFDEKLDEDED